jgi:hypothetical protein
VYGATTQEKLQGVAGQPRDDDKFMRKLAAKGVPAILAMLLVAAKSDRGRWSSGTSWVELGAGTARARYERQIVDVTVGVLGGGARHVE